MATSPSRCATAPTAPTDSPRDRVFCACLAKKILIANPMGYMADAAFNAAGRHAFDAWTGLAAYSFQIYFDFSGYSDMAVGMGLMFGFLLIRNFDARTAPRASPTSGGGGTSRCPRGCATTCMSAGRESPRAGSTYFNLVVVMLLGDSGTALRGRL